MKIKILKISLLSIVGTMLLVACSDNGENLSSDELSNQEIQNSILTDDITSDIDNVLEEDDYDYNLLGRSTSTSSISDCVTRTVVENANSKTITLDFGDSCMSHWGREFSGIIIIEYVQTSEGYSKTISFENFMIEGNAIQGGKSVVKVRENENGNREATHTVDITVIFENGASVTKTGTRVREMIAGADTRERGDDVYSISGNWQYTNVLGTVFTGNIVENLRREFACRFIVSGVTEITKNGVIYSLDFGDGSCDNSAILSNENGDSRVVTLRRF
ncbi:hypothetical protein [Tenacibaculum geojense]|uniref:Lipoprotein n=1 Tax=Tenacibaculum geojense TaxID=915352 RepID=A0ABW3JUG7_9FLAO